MGSRKYRECRTSPSEPNYVLYRPVLELNDTVRELNYPARGLNYPARGLNYPARDLDYPVRESNYLDLELELFLREPEESSISIQGLNTFV